MRAIVIHGTRKAEDLRVSDIPIPQSRPGWVVIRIHAAGMNHSEAILRLYEADREYIHTPIVPGIECAGEVVDPSDTPLQVGDRVIALMGGMGRSFDGSYAEYAVVPATCDGTPCGHLCILTLLSRCRLARHLLHARAISLAAVGLLGQVS